MTHKKDEAIFEAYKKVVVKESFKNNVLDWGKYGEDTARQLYSYAVHLGALDNNNVRDKFQNQLQDVIKLLSKNTK